MRYLCGPSVFDVGEGLIYPIIKNPSGKESTDVQITQNKGKERENSYRNLKRSPEQRHT